MDDLPRALESALVHDKKAMEYFSLLEDQEQQHIITQASSFGTRKEMRNFIRNLGRNFSGQI